MVACEHCEFAANPEPHATGVIPVTFPRPTLSAVKELITPSAAPIEAVPEVPLLANPLLLIAATELEEEVHVTEFVRFCVLPSL